MTGRLTSSAKLKLKGQANRHSIKGRRNDLELHLHTRHLLPVTRTQHLHFPTQYFRLQKSRTMYSSLALAAILARLAVAQTTCPNGQLTYTNNDGTYCCPGAVYGENNDAYCCVGADFEVATPSFADCFPFCSGSTNGVSVVPTTQQSCATTIPLTASDYSRRAAAAASATTTGGSSSSTSSGSQTSETGSVSSGSSSSNSTSSNSGSTAGGSNSATSGDVSGGDSTSEGSGGDASDSEGSNDSTASGSSSGSDGSDGSSGSDGSDSASTTSSEGVGAMVRSGPFVGAVMVAGGFLLAI